MHRDRIVLIGCVMLFCSGIVWGGLTVNIKFLKVESLHDLFEIFGAIATVAAVYIAATWKKQLVSTRDYELARKTAVSIVRYKESVIGAWEAASDCLVQEKSGKTIDSRTREILTAIYNSQLELDQQRRSEIQELVVECRAIWRNGIDKNLARAFAFEQLCSNCTKTYLVMIRPDNPVNSIVARYSLIKFREGLSEKNINNRDDAESYVDSLFSPVDNKLDEKMR
ncbi:hypothetical protein J1G33_20300 [Pseudomonas sp. P867]|uniref:hypothetical protein n=1 Tax=Pseudomonas sp. P867 TaxID=2816050 RepID=UPI001CA6D9A4|nr:hypothetical protein [Pseudomonas sp. P867]MBY8972739.1 hypothetical protein [Pseudomonas sp. P867]